jgi:probable phosphoglycerate mutase
MLLLTFIRHGETDWNRALRFQGHSDVPLNAAGLAQAAALGRRLAQEAAPDAVFSSDLQRARQTAEPALSHWRVPAALDAGLREQAFGVIEGLTAEAIHREHPALWQRWTQHEAGFAPPGGESTAQFSQRVLQAVERLATAHRPGPGPARHLVLFTHGGVLDMLWRHVHGLPLHGRRECAIPNTGVNRLRWDAGRLHIDTWGDASHLADTPLSP